MNKQVTHSEVLDTVNRLERMLDLNKAQIVQGGNSDRPGWAGSDWEKEDPEGPGSTPGGTDYRPKKPIAHKAQEVLDKLSDDEIEKYLNIRRSGVPNFVAAEMEIQKALPGAEKHLCNSCGGTKRDAIRKSMCGDCRGYGYIWMVDRPEDGDIIKAIEEKHNCHKAIQGPQRENRGGGSGPADTTPTDVTEYQDEELHQGATSPPGKTDNMSKANLALLGELKDAIGMFKAQVSKQMEMGDKDQDMMDEGEEPPPDDEEAEKCAKAVNKAMVRSMQVLAKSMMALIEQNEHLRKSFADRMNHQDSMIHAIGESNVSMAKSLLVDTGNGNGNGNRMPARSPKARQTQVQVLQKSFVDNAPGQQASDNGAYIPKYSLQELSKGAVDMVLTGKLKNHRVGLLLNAGTLPEDKFVKAIEAHIDANPDVINE